jgi:heme-degrading monooxygenase HmoA
MAVGMTVEIPGVTADQYQQVMEAMNWGQEPKPEGFLSHHACEKPGGLFVFDVWESPEHFQRFLESRLGAALGQVLGSDGPQPEPRFFPLIREEHR